MSGFARGKTGDNFHEAKVADVTTMADPDIVSNPFTGDGPKVDIWLNQPAK